MSTLPINLRKNIEEKRLNIEVQSLVVKEQLGKQAKVLTIQLQHISQPHSLHKHDAINQSRFLIVILVVKTTTRSTGED